MSKAASIEVEPCRFEGVACGGFFQMCNDCSAEAKLSTAALLDALVAEHPKNRGSLIPILQAIQDRQGYLSEEAIALLESRIDISANEIYGVATFYTQFRFTPPARHLIQVCQGTACHVRGSSEVLQEIERELSVEAGQVTGDGAFDLQRVACLGCCALAPVVAIDGEIHASMTPKKVKAMLAQYE